MKQTYFIGFMCLMFLLSCKKTEETDIVVENKELYSEALFESAMGIWERNDLSIGKFVYVIYGESKYIDMDAIFFPVDEDGFYVTTYLDVSVDTQNQCIIYKNENALWYYTKEPPKRDFQESMPNYSDGIIKPISINELSIDGHKFTRVTTKLSIKDVEGDWLRYDPHKSYYISFKSGQVETNYEDMSLLEPGISKGVYYVDQNESHKWARQYNGLFGINIAIDYTVYRSYYHAGFLVLTDYLGCYNDNNYFYKPTNK